MRYQLRHVLTCLLPSPDSEDTVLTSSVGEVARAALILSSLLLSVFFIKQSVAVGYFLVVTLNVLDKFFLVFLSNVMHDVVVLRPLCQDNMITLF